MSINVRLCQIITSHGSDVAKFSRGIGVNYRTASKWISEDRFIGSTNLIRIAKMWPDVDLHWLLTGEIRK